MKKQSAGPKKALELKKKKIVGLSFMAKNTNYCGDGGTDQTNGTTKTTSVGDADAIMIAYITM